MNRGLHQLDSRSSESVRTPEILVEDTSEHSKNLNMKFSGAVALTVLLVLVVFVQDSEQFLKKKKLKLLLGGAVVGGAVGGVLGAALAKHHHHPKIWIEKHHEP